MNDKEKIYGEPMYCTSFINNLREEQIDYVATEAMKWGKSGKPFIMTAMIKSS